MPSLFRKGSAKPAEDDIAQDLLDRIPDVPAPSAKAAPAPAPARSVPRPSTPSSPAPPVEARTPAIPKVDVHALMADLRNGLEAKLSDELARIEKDFGALVEHMRLQLISAHADLEKYRKEAEALREANAEQAKHLEILRELQEKLKRA